MSTTFQNDVESKTTLKEPTMRQTKKMSVIYEQLYSTLLLNFTQPIV